MRIYWRMCFSFRWCDLHALCDEWNNFFLLTVVETTNDFYHKQNDSRKSETRLSRNMQSDEQINYDEIQLDTSNEICFLLRMI